VTTTPFPSLVLWCRFDVFDETVRFYRDGFGFEIANVDAQSGKTSLRAGSQQIELTPIEGHLRKRQTGLSFHIHNVTRFLKHMAESNLIPDGAWRAYEHSGRGTTHIEDPSGNVVQLIEAGHA
jgi:catechol 2,3-dioxygenase-like lactoylglutathione lyase family enzyme